MTLYLPTYMIFSLEKRPKRVNNVLYLFIYCSYFYSSNIKQCSLIFYCGSKVNLFTTFCKNMSRCPYFVEIIDIYSRFVNYWNFRARNDTVVSKYDSLDFKVTSSAVLALYGCIWRRKCDYCVPFLFWHVSFCLPRTACFWTYEVRNAHSACTCRCFTYLWPFHPDTFGIDAIKCSSWLNIFYIF